MNADQKWRKPSNETQRNHREDALRAADRLHVQDLWRKSAEYAYYIVVTIVCLLVVHARGTSVQIKRIFAALLLYLVLKYENTEAEEASYMAIDPSRFTERSFPRRYVTFATCGDCLGTTRFTLEQLYILMAGLHVPEQVTIHGCRFSGEECLLIFLHKFSQNITYSELARGFYGGSDTLLSHAYHYMLNHIYTNFAVQLCSTTMLGKWAPYFPFFGDLIDWKLRFPKDGRTPFTYDWVHGYCCGFLDCTQHETCTPGSGTGTNGRRRADASALQEAFYNGYGSIHGLKSQALLFPNGFFGCIFCPTSVRESDISLYRMSGLGAAMAAICAAIGSTFFLYGDNIYRSDVGPHLKAPFFTSLLNQPNFLAGGGQDHHDLLVAQNRAWAALRIAIEWGFGDVKKYWKKMDSWNEQKLLRVTEVEGDVAREYAVAFFLTNCITAADGNTAASYFEVLRDVHSPNLEDYLRDFFD
jgi:hypothetical protein